MQDERHRIIKIFSTLLEDAIPLNLCPLRTTIVRGMRPPFLIKEEHGPSPRSRLHRFTSVFFSLHGTTHTDLPFALDWEGFELAEDLPGDIRKNINDLHKNRSDLMKKFYMPQILDCTVIDLSSKLDAARARIELPYDPSIKTETLDLSEGAFRQLRRELEIIPNDLKALKGKAHGKIVLFRTGWEEFQNGDIYLHPRWEAWGLYLTYPYLGVEGIRFLLEENVEGVGSDTADLEDPLFYVFPDKSRQPYLTRNLIRELRLPKYRPVHLHFLSKGKWLLEGLVNLKKISCEKGQVVNGYLVVCPFPIGTEDCKGLRIDDSMPLTLYFIPA